MIILLFVVICLSLHSQKHLEMTFTKIYAMGEWDDEGFSFSGSQMAVTKKYVQFLQDFLQKNHIRSVVDIGCGDWAFSRYIDWRNIHYIGIDIVKSVVERNNQLFATPSIHFVYANVLEEDLPDADLVLCKDVFQHLSNADITKLLKKFRKFKHCLITDYVDPNTLSSNNQDILSGGYHPIDLTKPPFRVKGKKVLLFQANFAPKQTIYIQH